MTRCVVMLLMVTLCTTGCIYRDLTAAGVKGRVIDSATGAPVAGARITRSASWGGDASPNIAPVTTVMSGTNGEFEIAPKFHISIQTYHFTTVQAWGTFEVVADGYATNEFHGVADAETKWFVLARDVALKKW